MEDSLTIDEIKSKIDIISLAERYGFEFGTPHGVRYRAKINLLRDEKTSSLDFFSDTQKYYDRGSASGGDCIDLIQCMDRLTQNEAIAKAKELSGSNSYNVERRSASPLQKEPKEEIDFIKLAYYAKKEIASNMAYRPRTVPIDICTQNGFIKEQTTQIFINSKYQKFFETSSFSIDFEAKLKYIFNEILGYSDYWQSPSVIIRDSNEKIVDVIAYRPKNKETGEEIKGMKYYYKNQDQRGSDFIYPFKNLVDRIASKEKYIVVGEGLKNSVNALLYNVPFITLESTGNIDAINENFINAINSFLDRGFGIVTAFDGDKVGKMAYNKFLSLTGFTAENIFDFESGIDFVEYVRGSK